MVASNDDSEQERQLFPFWYARVLGIFHADVFLSIGQQSLRPTRMEFLWVRWLGWDPNWKSGFKYRRLDRVGFVPHQDEDAFGFLDPAAVLRAAHLIPAFSHGKTFELCPPSVGRDDDGDWQYFYVNRFVDWDMLMRHLGVGIGHKSPTEKCQESVTVSMEGETNLDAQESDEDVTGVGGDQWDKGSDYGTNSDESEGTHLNGFGAESEESDNNLEIDLIDEEDSADELNAEEYNY